MSSSAGFSHIVAALRQRDFRTFACGNLLNHVGTWMQRVTAGWLAWELTHSATWLGLIGLAEFVPILVLGPISGVLADRLDRLSIIRVTQIGVTAAAAAIYAAMLMGLLTVELLFVLLLFEGICLSINQPARLTLLPSLVGPENMHAAIALNAMTFNGARFIGPAIAGVVITQWGVAPGFGWSMACFGVFTAALWFVHAPPQAEKPAGKRMLAEMAEGLAYTVRHAGIGPVMTTLMVTSSLGRSIVALFPGFASDVFDRGADGLAWLTSMVGVGAVVGGLYLARRPSIRGLTHVFIFNIAVIGGGLLAFSAHDIFWLGIALTLVLGWSLMINGIAAQTLIQNAVESSVRGRVVSLYGMVQRGGQALGSVVLGVTADLIGLRPTFAVAGLICLTFWVWSMRRAKAMAAALET